MTRQQQMTRTRTHDAGIFRDGMYFEPSRWSLSGEPRRRLAGYKRFGIFLVCAVTGMCAALHPALTGAVLLLTAAPIAGALPVLGFRRWQAWPHNRDVVKPVAKNIGPLIDQPRRWRSWLDIPEDYRTREDGRIATVDVPPDVILGDHDWEDIARVITAKTGIESPDVVKKLATRFPAADYFRSDPPPELVTWEQIKEHVYAASPDQFVIGIGKKGKIVKVSRQLDSPHLMINCGSGAGKSNLAAFLMLQALIRGGWGLFLDAKLTSHPWVYKDMAAEFDQLPNAGYARRIPVMHDALMWLGAELAHRYTLTERHVNARGDLLGRSVGPPVFVVAEEMNLSTPQLKEHWADLRAADKDLPKRSPALKALGALAFAGRAVDMHLIVIGQQLTAETLGTSGSQGGAVRSQMGIKMLARYDPNGWKMQAGDIPMPPSPTAPGRVQCLAGGEIHETQVPFVIERGDLRDLAAGGTVIPVPPEMPGTGPGPTFMSLPVPAEPPQIQGAAEQGLSLGRPTFRPPGTATLRELAAAGFYHSHEAAKQASKRDADHPEGVGWDGAAKLYKISAVAAYKAAKARRATVKR